MQSVAMVQKQLPKEPCDGYFGKENRLFGCQDASE